MFSLYTEICLRNFGKTVKHVRDDSESEYIHSLYIDNMLVSVFKTVKILSEEEYFAEYLTPLLMDEITILNSCSLKEIEIIHESKYCVQLMIKNVKEITNISKTEESLSIMKCKILISYLNVKKNKYFFLKTHEVDTFDDLIIGAEKILRDRDLVRGTVIIQREKAKLYEIVLDYEVTISNMSDHEEFKDEISGLSYVIKNDKVVLKNLKELKFDTRYDVQFHNTLPNSSELKKMKNVFQIITGDGKFHYIRDEKVVNSYDLDKSTTFIDSLSKKYMTVLEKEVVNCKDLRFVYVNKRLTCDIVLEIFQSFSEKFDVIVDHTAICFLYNYSSKTVYSFTMNNFEFEDSYNGNVYEVIPFRVKVKTHAKLTYGYVDRTLKAKEAEKILIDNFGYIQMIVSKDALFYSFMNSMQIDYILQPVGFHFLDYNTGKEMIVREDYKVTKATYWYYDMKYIRELTFENVSCWLNSYNTDYIIVNPACKLFIDLADLVNKKVVNETLNEYWEFYDEQKKVDMIVREGQIVVKFNPEKVKYIPSFNQDYIFDTIFTGYVVNAKGKFYYVHCSYIASSYTLPHGTKFSDSTNTTEKKDYYVDNGKVVLVLTTKTEDESKINECKINEHKVDEQEEEELFDSKMLKKRIDTLEEKLDLLLNKLSK